MPFSTTLFQSDLGKQTPFMSVASDLVAISLGALEDATLAAQ